MGLLGRGDLLKKEELKKEKVVLDAATDSYVFVRQMTAHEKNNWEVSQMKKVGSGKKASYDVNLDDFNAKLAVNCVCDEKGDLLFTMEDAPKLSKNMSAFTLEKIVEKARELNGISDKDKEEMVKN